MWRYSHIGKVFDRQPQCVEKLRGERCAVCIDHGRWRDYHVVVELEIGLAIKSGFDTFASLSRPLKGRRIAREVEENKPDVDAKQGVDRLSVKLGFGKYNLGTDLMEMSKEMLAKIQWLGPFFTEPSKIPWAGFDFPY